MFKISTFPFALRLVSRKINILQYSSQSAISHNELSRATLTIRNGPVFHGKSFGADANVSGEAVFSTGMVGYPESMTDPSYRGQILVFTQPMIGNYGVPSSTERDEFQLLKYMESPHIQCKGIVMSSVALNYSHWTAVESLASWCKREGIAAITDVDTRAIVQYLRERGSSLARISVGEVYDADEDAAFEDPGAANLVQKVSTKAPFHIPALPGQNPDDLHVAVLDCGCKENIMRCLVSRGVSITVFPYDFPIHKCAQYFDGIFLSNGPGDPTFCQTSVLNLRVLLNTYEGPIFGICLGHQLMALAAGARTVKLKYGNRAHNIPAFDLQTGLCHITSQNHGYAVDASTLPSDWKPYFVNLNDNSNEGIYHESRPIFTTQFHPEAKGGPLDTTFLFGKFLDNVRSYRSQRRGKGIPDTPISPLFIEVMGRDRVGVLPNSQI